MSVFILKVYYIASPSRKKENLTQESTYICICVLTFSLKYQIQIKG